MTIASAINGDTGILGCDFLKVLYEGEVQAGYFRGWDDVIVSKSAYIFLLVTIGETITSAYTVLALDDMDAWKSISK